MLGFFITLTCSLLSAVAAIFTKIGCRISYKTLERERLKRDIMLRIDSLNPKAREKLLSVYYGGSPYLFPNPDCIDNFEIRGLLKMGLLVYLDYGGDRGGGFALPPLVYDVLRMENSGINKCGERTKI